MEIESELKHYIERNLLAGAGPAAGIGPEEPLVGHGYLDSLGLMQLLSHVQQRWQIDLLAVASPQDFVSVASLARAIRQMLDG